MAYSILTEYLKNHQVNYRSLPHAPAFTSQEVAASAHISGKEMAKTVIIKLDGKLAMVVLPANEKVDLRKLQNITGAREVDLASESDFKGRFTGCEIGAMSPFGNLYDIPVYVSNALSQRSQIIFNAGSHSELISLAFRDFERLVKPKMVAL